MRGNIRVFCRTRYDVRGPCIYKFPTTSDIMVPGLQGQMKIMEFDFVYPSMTTQDEVFTDTKPTIMSVVDGYNVCIIAYGQVCFT